MDDDDNDGVWWWLIMMKSSSSSVGLITNQSFYWIFKSLAG